MRAWIFVLLVFAAGCGGGSGGSSGVGVAIAFPAPSTVLEAPFTQVVGTTDDPSDVEALEVNGVAAVSTDGFATWSAQVPLEPGPNTLRVDVRLSDGDEQVAAATSSVSVVRHVLPDLREITPGPAGEYYVLDRASNSIYRLEAGTTTLVSGAARGTGEPMPSSVRDMVVDAPRNRVLVLDSFRILAVDVTSGNRTVFVDGTDGSDPGLAIASGMDIDLDAQRLVVADQSGDGSLVLIDLVTATRTQVPDGGPLDMTDDVAVRDGTDLAFVTVFTENGAAVLTVNLLTGVQALYSEAGVIGAGPALEDPNSLVWTGDSLLWIERNADACFAIVDDISRDRVLVSGLGRGNGEGFGSPQDIALGQGDATFVACDNQVDQVLVIQTGTGDRSPLYEYGRGAGPALQRPEGLKFDAASNQAFVLDSRAHRLLRVDLETGDRLVVTDNTRGPAGPWRSPVGLDLDLANDIAYVVDNREDALYAVDLTSGGRTVISSFDLGIGSGPELRIPQSVSIDRARGLAYVSDSHSQVGGVWSIDLTTGDRVKLADNTPASPFRFAEGSVFDPARDVLFVSDQGEDAIFAIDVLSGVQTVLSSNTTGAGPFIVNHHDVDLDTARNRALVPDDTLGALFGVDLSNGDRTLISSSGIGLGPDLRGPEHAVPGPGESILLVDMTLGALLVIEPTTGARALLSR